MLFVPYHQYLWLLMNRDCKSEFGIRGKEKSIYRSGMRSRCFLRDDKYTPAAKSSKTRLSMVNNNERDKLTSGSMDMNAKSAIAALASLSLSLFFTTDNLFLLLFSAGVQYATLYIYHIAKNTYYAFYSIYCFCFTPYAKLFVVVLSSQKTNRANIDNLDAVLPSFSSCISLSRLLAHCL